MIRGLRRRAGFTIIEVVVAIGVAVILFGICGTVFVKVNAFKRRSEQLLFMHQEANGALTRVARDIEGLYVAGAARTDYWKLESGAMGAAGDRLTLVCAGENRGRADFCQVQYYVKDGKLYRVLSGGAPPNPPGSWSLNEADWVLAGGTDIQIQKLYLLASGAGPVPETVTVTLTIADPKFLPRSFSITVRPGSEEN
jgi:type II secretory pathway pseudopilin PulG